MGLDVYDYLARVYNPAAPHFWQMDPKAETSRRFSTYAYCLNNPVFFVDPDGMEAQASNIIKIKYNETDKDGNVSEKNVTYKNEKVYNEDGTEYKGGDKYVSKVVTDLNEIKNSGDTELAGKLNTLEKSEETHTISNTEPGENNSNTPENGVYQSLRISTGSDTKYNPDALKNATGEIRNPNDTLVHELLGHGFDNNQGTYNSSKTNNGIPMYEVNAVNTENRMRAKNNEPQRTTYGKSKSIPPSLLINTHKKK